MGVKRNAVEEFEDVGFFALHIYNLIKFDLHLGGKTHD